jgi:hypothetical protein
MMHWLRAMLDASSVEGKWHVLHGEEVWYRTALLPSVRNTIEECILGTRQVTKRHRCTRALDPILTSYVAKSNTTTAILLRDDHSAT